MTGVTTRPTAARPSTPFHRRRARAVGSLRSSTVPGDENVGLDTALFADGVGLDSLQTAELSAVLEDELGRDPFSAGEMPRNLGEIVAFYDAEAS